MSNDAASDPGVPAPRPVDEQHLIARSQQGDRAAFNTLLERYQAVAYGLALRMLGDADLAADVTQDACFAAFRHLASFRGASFRAWLLRIVSNGCYDVFRARARQPSTSLEGLLAHDNGGTRLHPAEMHMPAALRDEAWDPERAALRGETIAAIEAALLCLPQEQRLAIILSDVQGLPYEEITRIMESPLGTVKSRIARGRAQLRTLLTSSAELLSPVERPHRENEGK